MDPAHQTYEAFLGLVERPFSLTPDPKYYFRSRSQSRAFDAVSAGIDRHDGLLQLTGDLGVGKTTLCRTFIDLLQHKTRAALVGSALVSPEDIGCGPLTRSYGAGKPESCFMLYDTEKAREARTWKWIRRRGIPWPIRHLNLDDYYVTHDLPETLARRGFTWCPMRVHASPSEAAPVYIPPFTPEYWADEFSRLRYGMGNFYSLDGQITHYHNWFDRVPKNVPIDSLETTEGQGKGLPLAFLSLGTRHFMTDLQAGELVLPSADEPQPEPRATPRHTPDLTRPFSAR